VKDHGAARLRFSLQIPLHAAYPAKSTVRRISIAVKCSVAQTTSIHTYEAAIMKHLALNALIAVVAGMVGAVAVVELRYAPGSWFSIAGDPKSPDFARKVVHAAPEDITCLYAGQKYKPGDVLKAVDVDVQLICTSKENG
jgi:hypothetical protein